MIYGRNIYFRNFKLGAFYAWKHRIFQFIKVTPKGFNLLEVQTHKCFFRKHLYSKVWTGKDIPHNITEVKNCAVPDMFTFTEITDTEEQIREYLKGIKSE